MRKLPIGVQSFGRIITDGFVYADKTEYIYRLAQNNVPYFLSRPRRFGKSLLISTLKAYWEGRKELFRGLRIEELEKDRPDAWKAFPVFHFDFNGQNYQTHGALEQVLGIHLSRWEETYALTGAGKSLGERFQDLLTSAYRQTGLRCVVLVDEYDKPLLDSGSEEEYNKAVFKGFFSTLKSYDEYLQFVFITGVTKFQKVSIFSDLNQLRDISFSKEYAGICGITEEELNRFFAPEMEELAVRRRMSANECKAQLKKAYDGYLFHPDGDGVYNPFSLLNAFADGDFGSYWFETGTPSFLVQRIRRAGFDVRKFTDNTLYATESMLSDYRADDRDLVPLLYQTGYLTIRAYDHEKRRYTLGFPNEEVAYGMLENLMPEYAPAAAQGTGTDVFTLDDYIEEGNLEGIRNILTALFASIPYTAFSTPFEHDFQSVLYVLFMLLGKFVQCERHTWQGQIDCVLQTKRYIYIFEFKRDASAEDALRQIEKMEYAKPFAADHRKLFKIGVGFDSEKRTLADWKVARSTG